MSKKDVGNRLKQFADARYGSYAEFARDIGMHPSGLHSNYFSGKHYPGAEILIKLHFFGCDVAWLLTGDGLGPEATDEEIDAWYEKCTRRHDGMKSRNKLDRDAEAEIVESMRRFQAQKGQDKKPDGDQ